MRRDLVYFYPAPMKPVFDAFINAANQKFGKKCRIVPFKTISFGLDYSFRYNMNGGSLTAHFMPHQNGTAVNLRYTMVQAIAGRYQRHAQDYTSAVDGILRLNGTVIQLDVQQFLDYEAKTPTGILPNQPQQPMQQQNFAQQPMQQPAQQAPRANFCTKCGAPLTPNASFCTKCGNKI